MLYQGTLIAHKRELASLLANPVLSKEFLNLIDQTPFSLVCERSIASAWDPKKTVPSVIFKAYDLS
jgi:hypothetical protein